MRRPPEPHYSFTIPSIHDDTTLDGRVYHPNALNEPPADAGVETQWRKRGIVMAHPYAPMGGSCDDRIVGIVVDEFLRAGWVVGTFNFRGAHGSKGHTSWSGKPELDDYISFAAFFMHYMCYLQPSPAPDAVFTPEQSPISPSSKVETLLSNQNSDGPPVVVLGGYSYGSLILKYLPPVPTIVQPFAAPIEGSAADEILLRARKLADQSNLEWINQAHSLERERKAARKGYEPKLSVTMGGEETSPDKRRSSREVRRSFDGRRSLDIGNRLRSLSHRKPKDEAFRTPPEEPKHTAITMPNIRYLLVSPLTPPISTLAAPALAHKFWSRPKDNTQELFGKYPSLAIYGDQDIFASAKKTRDWAAHFRAASGSQFTSVEVDGAGHFWVEMGVEERLRSTLRTWEPEIRDPD